MHPILLLAAVLLPHLGESKGGNCKNECQAAMGKPFTDCKEKGCTQLPCASTVKPLSSNCTCPTECQACYDDILDGGGFMSKSKAKCVGCTDKGGYDFNKDVWPELRKEAEDMGCNGNANTGGGVKTFNMVAVFFVVAGMVSVL
jgi:hypothetical protein